MNSTDSITKEQFETQFNTEGKATLPIQRSFLDRFKKVVRQCEKKGKHTWVERLMCMPPVSNAIMGKIDARDETPLIYVFNFDRISHVEIDDSGSGDPMVTLYRKNV